MRLASRLLARRGAHNLATVPNATLRLVAGAGCARLVVKTNMETYSAQLEGVASDGSPIADAELAAWAAADAQSGDLDIDARSAHAVTVSVPASYNVSVAASGDTDVEMQGWLEGTVDVVVAGRGAVGVNTVRGLLTSVRTGGGDVSVDHVEGNLTVQGAHDVKLGKIMGEDVRVAGSGLLRSRAVYAKRIDVRTDGGMNAAVVSAEEGLFSVRGDCTLNSAEGVLQIVHRGASPMTVQASEQLRSLTVSRAAESGDASPHITVHLPEGMAARAEVLAAELTLAEALEAVSVPRGSGGAITAPVAELSTSGTKEFAGYEHGSTTSDVPWWSAEARNTWITTGDAPLADGSAAYLLGGASVEGTACEMRIIAADARVDMSSQSWFQQRLKSPTERKAQPYR